MTTKKTLFIHLLNRRTDWKRFFVEVIISIFIALWMYVSITKLFDYRSVELQMSTNPLFYKIPRLITFGIPAIEFLLATMLVFKKTKYYSLILSLILITLFTGYIIYMMIYSPTLPCTCGGAIAELSWEQHLVMNGILILFGLWALLLLGQQRK